MLCTIGYLLGCCLTVSMAATVSRYRGGPVNVTRICGSPNTVSSGDYTLVNSLSRVTPAPVGQQCCNIDRRDNSSIGWTTNFHWSSTASSVRGYSAVQQNLGVGQRLVSIASMPTTWQYTLNTDVWQDLTFRMLIDLYTAPSPVLTTPATNEITIWTSSHFMSPLSSNGSTPFVQGIAIANVTWNLWRGVNGGMTVYSFLPAAASTAAVKSVNFRTDTKLFLQYLMNRDYISGGDYLNTVKSGVQVVKGGNTTIQTTFFNIDINPGPPLTTPFIPLHTPLCGLVDNVTTPDGQYTVYNNEWGVLVYIAKGVPYNGTQCSVVDALPDADSIAWTVNYRWNDTSPTAYVKGFPDAQLNKGAGTRLTNIASLPTTWSYNMTYSTKRTWFLDYNVAYDFFTGVTPNTTVGAPHTNEIMIWTSRQYMLPVTDRGPDGKPVPLAKGLILPLNGNFSWTLYGGTANGMGIYSYVNEHPGPLPSHTLVFQEDMMIFIRYLIQLGKVDPNDYLNVMQAGSEVIDSVDPATLKTSYYKLKVNQGPLNRSTVPVKFVSQ